MHLEADRRDRAPAGSRRLQGTLWAFIGPGEPLRPAPAGILQSKDNHHDDSDGCGVVAPGLLSESTHPCAPLSSSPTGESGTVPVEDTQARGSGGVGQRQVPMLDLIMILMQLVWLRVLPQHMGTRLTDLSSTRWQKCSRTSAKSPPSSTTSPPPSPSSGRAPVCQTPHAPRLCVLTFVVALL